jgi:hypothetical protein
MFKLRLAILGAAAALSLGTAGVLAMTASVGSDPDAHGDAVASAARHCPHGASGVHGACVSAIASAEGQENSDQQTEDTGNATVKACKATDVTEDGSETAPAKGDRSGKSADKTENKTEHAAFATCVSGQANGS